MTLFTTPSISAAPFRHCQSLHFSTLVTKPKQWDEESTSGAFVFEEESLFISPCLRVSDFLSAQLGGEEELIQDDKRGALRISHMPWLIRKAELPNPYTVHDLLKLYNDINVPPKCLLFKIPSTWQGIEAANLLESEGIQTHLTFVYRLRLVHL
ncbi:hypothetical protein QN277_016368 [Acacia crassicarpa]|uniref:Uncharacterized protein n=1 Tax=Acacia crassicarpa TaxID=499986 RepID=A0AAE1MWH8_9FABA|nr:hypothetical protein QN277_016368 [Acacia crassicarpa]